MENKKKRKKLLLWLAVIITIIVIIAILGRNSSNIPTVEEIKEKGISIVKWNKENEDAMKNGNIQTAAQVLLALPDKELKTLQYDISPALVLKTPWKYYGKYIKFSGIIGMIKEYQAGSEISHTIANGKECFEAHIITSEDSVPVCLFVIGSSNRIKEGDALQAIGFPVGTVENKNILGGTVNELVVVGKIYK